MLPTGDRGATGPGVDAGATVPSASGDGSFSSSSTKRCSVPTASPRPSPLAHPALASRCAGDRAASSISASPVRRPRRAADAAAVQPPDPRCSPRAGHAPSRARRRRSVPRPRAARAAHRAGPSALSIASGTSRPTRDARTPPGRADRRRATRRASRRPARGWWIAHRSASSSRRSTRSGTRAPDAPVSSRPASALARRRPGPAPGDRVLDHAWSNPVRPGDRLDVLLAHQLARDLPQHRHREVDRPGRALRAWRDRRAASTRSSLNCANRDALSTAFTNAPGSSRQRSPGILARRERGDLHLDVEALLPLVPLLGRVLAGGVGVVREHHVTREALQDLHVLVGQRGAAGGDRVRDAREREPHDVGVALADHHLVARADLRLRPVQAVEQPALVVQRRLRGVLVLRPVVGERPTAEARPGSPRGRRSGTTDATRKKSCAFCARFTNASPAATMSSPTELQRVEVAHQRVEPVRCPAEAELARRVAVEPATAQVPACVAAGGVLQQEVVVEVDRRLHRRGQPLALAAVLGRARRCRTAA